MRIASCLSILDWQLSFRGLIWLPAGNMSLSPSLAGKAHKKGEENTKDKQVMTKTGAQEKAFLKNSTACRVPSYRASHLIKKEKEAGCRRLPAMLPSIYSAFFFSHLSFFASLYQILQIMPHCHGEKRSHEQDPLGPSPSLTFSTPYGYYLVVVIFPGLFPGSQPGRLIRQKAVLLSRNGAEQRPRHRTGNA